MEATPRQRGTGWEGDYRGLHDEKHAAAQEQVAVCRMTYRSTLFQLWGSDVASVLIGIGAANASPSLVEAANTGGEEDGTERVLETSHKIQDLRKDVRYLEHLANAEVEAAKDSKGMWSVTEVREEKRNVVEEAEFQMKATSLQKLSRWVRGG